MALWLLAFASIISFDSSDWPSHTVAVHNDPTRNLCGIVGSVIAYWSYFVIGIGSWILLIALAAYLGVTVTGRLVSHPLVRMIGTIFVALAVSSLHALIFSLAGPLAGSHAGLVATWTVSELSQRFSGVGTFLVLTAALAVGAVVAVDTLALAVPRTLAKLVMNLRHLPRPSVASLGSRLRRLGARPELALQAPGTVSIAASRDRRRKARESASIDPDAGGIGATEAFDPEQHAIDEDHVSGSSSLRSSEPASEDETGSERKKLSADELRAKIARLPVRMAGVRSGKAQVARDEDIPRQENFEGYRFPTLELLENPETNFSEKMEAFVRNQAQVLEEALQTYNIDGEVVGIESGPVVTLYSVQLAPGTKVAKVQAVASDLARSLRAHNIRIVPNMVGKTTVGIEVPNLQKERVRLKELMSGGQAEGMQLPMFLGKDVSGEPLVADLTRMPHMLIAGTTGSGKSVCINTILMSWLYTKRPDELKLVLVDPKMVELSQFSDIPHLMCPVVTEMGRAAAILEWAISKMEERYELLNEAAVRDVASYNTLSEEELYERFQPENDAERARIPKKLPYMVFVIDELADLIMTHKEVEQSIVRIAQKARAVGIHLMLATQRPQANVVTGLIKSNMPCRVAFKVASGMDSRIVLDQKGAELLLGQGDMLFLTPHTSEVKRAQGTLVTDGEIRKVARFLRDVAAPTFERSLLAIRPGVEAGEGGEGLNPAERDPMFDEAVRIMIESGRGSVSLLQRRLAIGYSRASRLVDQMGLAGILGEHKGSVAREVLISLEEWEQMRQMEEQGEAGGTLFASEGDEDSDGDDDRQDDDGLVIETFDHSREETPADE